MKTLENEVYEKLESDILNGVLTHDETLSEIKVCERYGVSRTPAREALLLLEKEGLIRSTGRGIKIVGISDEDIDDIYAIRMRIEGLASKFMAERASESEIKALSEAVALQEFYSSKNDAQKLRELDTRFHEIVYRASASKTLIGTLSTFHKQICVYREKSLVSPERSGRSVAEHKQILEAISARKGDLAEKLTYEHVKNAYEHILKTRKKNTEA
ncbi:MAG: GntR family transcriptional regulator [Clostridia bacterium]|nr:GntR family transcriptional regulator [Clostridia bacterium]